MPVKLTQDQFLLINLLLRIAVMAGIVSLVLSFNFVLEYLTKKLTGAGAKFKLFVLMSVVFSVGVLVRKLVAQGAMDLSLEGTMFAGFIGGVWVGTGVGLAVGLTGYFLGETVALPFYAAAGLICGLLYTSLERKGEIWSYSLNPFFVIYSFLEKLFRRRLDINFVPFAFAFVFAFIRYRLLSTYSSRLIYGFVPRDPLFVALDLAVLVYALGIALKMTNNARVELLLKEEEKQLISARLATLRSQINPHFLFNTLNSIYALIRTDAEKAREMTRKLASIFRRSLEENSDIHSFEEELRFIDDYLSIELVRFGEERLKVEKEIEPGTLKMPVPFMILQPVVENAVKHGISCISKSGTIKISARKMDEGLLIEIQNDGPVVDGAGIDELKKRGMGIGNVTERLNIYSRGRGKFEIDFKNTGGAVVRLFIPLISAEERT